ncbi:MAG: hypothetical protein QXG00_06905 [Candidatus Woesearchaeota archaeon]
MAKKIDKSSIIYVRWCFRVITILLLLLMLMFIFGDGLPHISDFSVREILLLICFLGMTTGLVYIWFNERIGSLILFISSLLFWIINIIFTGNFWLGWFFLIYPALSFIFFILSRIQLKK